MQANWIHTYEGRLFLVFLVLLAVCANLVLGIPKQTAGLPGHGSDGFISAHQSFLSATTVNLHEIEPLAPQRASSTTGVAPSNAGSVSDSASAAAAAQSISTNDTTSGTTLDEKQLLKKVPAPYKI